MELLGPITMFGISPEKLVEIFAPPLITAAAGIVAAIILALGTIIAAKKHDTSQEPKKKSLASSAIMRGMIVFGVGIAAAFAVNSVNVSVKQAQLEQDQERIINVQQSFERNQTHLASGPSSSRTTFTRNLAAFRRTQEGIGAEVFSMDKEAAVILENLEPREWKTNRRTFKIDEVLYVPGWEWVDVVFPDKQSTRIEEETCGIEATGELKIRGFSTERNSALIEYTAPGDSWGTPCDTGTYFLISTRKLGDFPSTQEGIGAEVFSMDKEAAVILENLEPREWKTNRGTFKVDEVLYAPGWEWVDVVFPDKQSTRIEEETCGIEATGELKIRGFSTERNSALIEYTAPGDSRGTPCDTGTYFFYGLPERN